MSEASNPIEVLQKRQKEQLAALKAVHDADEAISKQLAKLKELEEKRDERYNSLLESGFSVRELSKMGVAKRATSTVKRRSRKQSSERVEQQHTPAEVGHEHTNEQYT